MVETLVCNSGDSKEGYSAELLEQRKEEQLGGVMVEKKVNELDAKLVNCALED